MFEYIERGALIEEINLQKRAAKTSFPKLSFVVGDVLTCIYNAPTVDAVPVVRCRNCLYSFKFTDADGNKRLLCTEIGRRGIDPDGFCSYGKRSEY